MPRSSRPSGGPRQKSRGAAEATAALAFLRAVEHLRGPIISRNVVSIRAGHKSSSEFAAIVTAVLSIIVKDVGKIGVRRISSPTTTDCRIRKFWTSRLVLGRRVSRTCLLVLLRVFARGLRFEIPVRLSVCDSRVMFVCESLRNTDLAICCGRRGFSRNLREWKLTTCGPESTPNLSSPPLHPDILRPVWLGISQCAAGRVPADPEARGALHSAIQICSVVNSNFQYSQLESL